MDLVNLHRIATYLLLSTGTFALWMGEPEFTVPYPLVAVICSILAYFLTDRWNILRLPHLLSNGLGIVIILVIYGEFRQTGSSTVLALAHFLVYLQIAKSFREKQPADYWLLYVINVLQVTIGCVVNRNVEFGLLLIAYVLLAICTLILFQMVRHHEQMSRLHGKPLPLPRLTWSVAAPSLAISALTLPMALGLFWTVPRFSRSGDFRSGLAAETPRQLVTGFADTVRLDEVSTVMESQEVALDVWARDSRGAPAELPGDVLWRGKVFTTYRNREWLALSAGSTPGPQPAYSWGEQPALAPGQVELTIEQAIQSGDTLFCVRPVYWAGGAQSQEFFIQYLQLEGRLTASNSRKSRRSAGSIRRYRMIVDVNQSAYRDPKELAPSPEYLKAALQLPEGFDRLKKLATDLTAGAPADSAAKVDRILNHLLATGEYAYSLDLPKASTSLDPVEEFLFVRKIGHCEYFASSLALLLRAAGIPSRVVNGFKGVDYNQPGGYYQVRQLLAHSWVEAYIAEDRCWRTFDPTPGAAREAQLARYRSIFQPLFDLADAGSRFWSGSIVDYGESGQTWSVAKAFDASWFVAGWRQLQLWTASNPTPGSPTQTDSAESAMGRDHSLWFVFLPIGAMAAIAWIARRFTRRRQSPQAIARRTIAAYDRFIRELGRLGVHRSGGQTPRELAEALSSAWQKSPALAALASLPTELIEAYYATRYGHRTLAPEQAERFDRLVSEAIPIARRAGWRPTSPTSAIP